MIPVLEFFFPVTWFLLLLFLVWYFLLTDCDAVLAFAEKFGRPVGDFKRKVVWVTGASSGLGEAMAYELASVGAKLILTARSEDLLQKVKEDCIELSQGQLEKKDILVLPFDLSRLECHKENVEKAVNHFGKIDVLINNAARYQIGEIIETDIEVDKAIFDVNFFGTVSLTKLLLKHFLQNGGGRIVVISSIAGKYGIPSTASYAATKHALQILQKDYIHYECTNMSSERCAHLTLVAAINKLFESWIAYQPFLLMLGSSQYVPDLYKYVMNIIYTKKRVSQLQEGKWPHDLPVWRPLFKKATSPTPVRVVNGTTTPVKAINCTK
ncbi:dehydrogenase/reductase SDR family member 7-like isoform X2 [Stegodyphus dumicola]|uniref:dehydrogenase/reductase SDR family member 7-like isoform X2 n=1 Tax=Stegodyphus dumicola TaxID=202533 RepID=UPI0015AFDA43|nr:dehydrogenase/reductase SDR family member 7-like isoform X2 [Stegodyphus dumicola]